MEDIALKKYLRGLGFYLVLFLIILTIFVLTSTPETPVNYVYSDLINMIKEGKVTDLQIVEAEATATLSDGTKIVVVTPGYGAIYASVGEDIERQVALGTLRLSTPEPASPPWWLSFLPTIGLILIMVVFWIFFMKQAQGGGPGGAMSFGKSRARLSVDDKNKKTFADVAGEDEEKEELQEIVEFLKNPQKFRELGARIPKGFLLVGPPGTGKTLLAKAVAGEAGVPFFSISGSDFVEMFVGVGASRVRDLFEQAKKSSPCIIFIDEIDAVGRQRGAGLGGGHDEREQTLNQLLVEMDGFSINEGVIVIAATNRPDILDSALLRPGRFDRQVLVDAPDVKGREEILKVHSKGKPLAEDVKLDVLAKTTVGFTGADLENLVNEAALRAAKNGQKEITMFDLEESIMKVIAGPEKKTRVVTEKERKLTAYHEAGHAVVSKMLPTQNRVHQISIIPRGRAGGYTLSLPKEDTSYTSKTEMCEEIVSLLGGRVAEKLFLDDISTGASNDIERATAIAKNMVVKYGMSDELGTRTFGSSNDEVFIGRDFGHTKDYSEAVAAKIDAEIKNIIDKAYEDCSKILSAQSDKVKATAELLLEKEKVDAEEFETLFAESVDISTSTEESKNIEITTD
ncbi:MAG: ATP-dependent zinc metalloprotease FtsH [Clostridia bacterium]|nr:ATP-dependent zinc metalloprotease FtsH [Clostridia bacterium]